MFSHCYYCRGIRFEIATTTQPDAIDHASDEAVRKVSGDDVFVYLDT